MLISNPELHQVPRFRVGSHRLPIEVGIVLILTRAIVCAMFADPAKPVRKDMFRNVLPSLQVKLFSLDSLCSGIMADLVLTNDQPAVVAHQRPLVN